MERKKMGRPKSKEPTRNRNITFRLSELELQKAQEICDSQNIRYIDIFVKGIEVLSKK